MAAAKKPTQKQRDEVIARYAQDYENLKQRLWDTCRDNAAAALKLAPEEIEEEFAELT